MNGSPTLKDTGWVAHCDVVANLHLSLSSLQERSEQHDRGQTGRTDGIAFRDGLGGVADRVERIGYLADRLGHLGHLGDAARVVGDRAEGVDRDDDSGHREHRHDGDCDPVQACRHV